MSLLNTEVRKIKTDEVADFVLEAFAHSDPQFWETPSSPSGKYHSPENQGKGGLVRHTVKAVAVVIDFADRARFTDIERDAAIAAMLLHDIKKNGDPWGDKTDPRHGLIASEWLRQFYLEDQTLKEMILSAVRYHMAPWCYAVNLYEKRMYSKEEMMTNVAEVTRALVAPSRIELAVREGDYWASRQSMSFFPGRTVQCPGVAVVHDAPEEAAAAG